METGKRIVVRVIAWLMSTFGMVAIFAAALITRELLTEWLDADSRVILVSVCGVSSVVLLTAAEKLWRI